MMRFQSNLDDVQRKLTDLQSRARALHGKHQVRFSKILTPAFMLAHTDCGSSDDLFQKGGIVIASQEDFEQRPTDELDRAVAAHSTFRTWSEMLQAAMQEWVRQQLGL